MIDSLVQFADKLTSDLSLRRVGVITALLVVALLALVGYEAFTHHYRLENLKARAEALKSLAEAAEHAKNSSVEQQLTAPITAIADQLREEVAPEPFEPRRLWQALASAAFWFFFVLNLLQEEEDKDAGLLALLVLGVGVISGLVAYFFPVTWHWSVRYLLLPFVNIVVVLFLSFTLMRAVESSD